MLSVISRPTQRRLLPALLLASFLGACGGGGEVVGGGSGTTQVAATPPPPASAAWAGHFVGTVRTATATLFGDAILTADGLMRLYVGGPYNDSGALQVTKPTDSAQFFGNLNVSVNEARATGLVMGQQCAAAPQVRFCDEPVSADISMSVNPGPDAAAVGSTIEGQIQVATQAGNETWVLHLTHWPAYGSATLTGQFKELLAEFATGDDTVIVIDGTGALSFQSAHSGCTGNGTLAAHSDGTDSASDATLTIGNCTGVFAYLNGEYTGLATSTPSSYWDYDALLRVWLSKRPESVTPAALVLLSDPL